MANRNVALLGCSEVHCSKGMLYNMSLMVYCPLVYPGLYLLCWDPRESIYAWGVGKWRITCIHALR